MHQASVGFHCPECTKQGAQKVYQGAAALRDRPIVTQVLMGLNVLVFVLGAIAVRNADYLSGSITQFHIDFASIAKAYTNSNQGIQQIGVGNGEWYRLVTSGFVHFGIIHIAVNMWSLWILGTALEQYAGRLRFGIIYAVSLLAGSFGSLIVTPDALSAGASGAIFGLMGALFLAYRERGIPLRSSPLLNVLILNIIITFAIPSISKGAHLGGLAGGALAGWLFFDLARRPGVGTRGAYVMSGAVMVALVVGAVVFANGYQPG